MPDFDDELAALLALDALEADEQADAELRIGTFPTGLIDASAALAEGSATNPPQELRAAALGRALERRRPGRPVDGPAGCPPVEAFSRTVQELHELLDSLDEAEWEVVAHPVHGEIRNLIAHLVGVEVLCARWLDPADEVPYLPDHVAATAPVVEELRGTDPREVARRWYTAAQAVAAAAASGDPRRQVPLHDVTTNVAGLMVARSFELWAHAMDIAVATGRALPPLDPERFRTLSGRLMDAVPLALAYRRTTAPGRTARFVLTGPSGGCYNVALHPGDALGEPAVTVIADTVELCRLAANRLRPDQLRATIEGDRELADLVLAGLDAYARD